jgi:hypothetical protein
MAVSENSRPLPSGCSMIRTDEMQIGLLDLVACVAHGRSIDGTAPRSERGKLSVMSRRVSLRRQHETANPRVVKGPPPKDRL